MPDVSLDIITDGPVAIPADATNIRLMAWGGGGNAFGATTFDDGEGGTLPAGGGGGGAGYRGLINATVAGQTLDIVVGGTGGDDTTIDIGATNIVTAEGGSNGSFWTNGTGGGGSVDTGYGTADPANEDGADGTPGAINGNGGNGGRAGNTAEGGGGTRSNGFNSAGGFARGGGAAGGDHNASTSAANGAAGLVRIEYDQPEPDTTLDFSTNDTVAIPADATDIRLMAWGPGGDGGDAGSTGFPEFQPIRGGGGGGGEYRGLIDASVAGETLTLTFNAGDTRITFSGGTLVDANAGGDAGSSGGSGGAGGTGGTANATYGTPENQDGSAGQSGPAGGDGGAAGNIAEGGGGTETTDEADGNPYGGGAAGGFGVTFTGGDGAAGHIRITYNIPVPAIPGLIPGRIYGRRLVRKSATRAYGLTAPQLGEPPPPPPPNELIAPPTRVHGLHVRKTGTTRRHGPAAPLWGPVPPPPPPNELIAPPTRVHGKRERRRSKLLRSGLPVPREAFRDPLPPPVQFIRARRRNRRPSVVVIEARPERVTRWGATHTDTARIFGPAQYQLLRTVSPATPEEGATAYATAPSLPATPGETFGDDTWNVAAERDNGLLRSGIANTASVTLAGGEGVDMPPLAPTAAELEYVGGGVVQLAGLYRRHLDPHPAALWAWAVTTDGSAPGTTADDTRPVLAEEVAQLLVALPAVPASTVVRVRLWLMTGSTAGPSVLATITTPDDLPQLPTADRRPQV